MNANEIGNNIRAARVAKGLTQEKLAAAAGRRSVNQINGYERGRSRPSAPVLADIAAALDVSPETLLGDAERTIEPTKQQYLIQDFKRQLADLIQVPGPCIKITIEIIP